VKVGTPLSWRTPCITVAVDRSVSDRDDDVEAMRGAARSALSSWEAVECGERAPIGLHTIVIDDVASCARPLYDRDAGNVNLIAFVDDWSARDYSDSALALTFVWFDTDDGEIVDADIVFNRETRPWDARSVAGPLTHEAGHFFGLGHSAVPGARMTPSDERGDPFALHPDDKARLCEAYPPGRLAARCDFQPVGGLQLECAGGLAGGGCTVSPGVHTESSQLGWVVSISVVFATSALRSRRRARDVGNGAPSRSPENG
jgi:hypothetical protein